VCARWAEQAGRDPHPDWDRQVASNTDDCRRAQTRPGFTERRLCCEFDLFKRNACDSKSSAFGDVRVMFSHGQHVAGARQCKMILRKSRKT